MTEHLASLGAVAVPRERYSALLATALGEGAEGSDGASSAGASAGPGEFWALDALLEAAGAAGAGGPAGKVIAQLLGQTS